MCSTNTKPEQAAFMSKHSVSVGSPRAPCTMQAVLGIIRSGDMVATRHTSTSSDFTPLRSMAAFAAAMHRLVWVSSIQ